MNKVEQPFRYVFDGVSQSTHICGLDNMQRNVAGDGASRFFHGNYRNIQERCPCSKNAVNVLSSTGACNELPFLRIEQVALVEEKLEQRSSGFRPLSLVVSSVPKALVLKNAQPKFNPP
jgi:hypothetical protein